MGGVVAGIVNDGSFQMQGQKPQNQQNRQRPVAHEPAPDAEAGQAVTQEEQTHCGIEGGRRIQELFRDTADLGR